MIVNKRKRKRKCSTLAFFQIDRLQVLLWGYTWKLGHYTKLICLFNSLKEAALRILRNTDKENSLADRVIRVYKFLIAVSNP